MKSKIKSRLKLIYISRNGHYLSEMHNVVIMRNYYVVVLGRFSEWQIFIRYLLQRCESYRWSNLLTTKGTWFASDTLDPSKDSGRLKIYERIFQEIVSTPLLLSLCSFGVGRRRCRREKRKKKRRPDKKSAYPWIDHVSHATTQTRLQITWSRYCTS